MPNPAQAYRALTSACQVYHARLIAVSKTRTLGEILQLYHQGQRAFGENRAHELLSKAVELPADIEWHLIGHLQTNKVKTALPYVACIQSLDSVKLWDKIEDESARLRKVTSCLLQIKIASEDSKYGWAYDDLRQVLEQGKPGDTPHIALQGVMGMATLTNDKEQVRQEMRYLKTCFERLKQDFFRDQDSFNTISMGMSGDFQIALEEGSTMIRVGSLLFGERG